MKLFDRETDSAVAHGNVAAGETRTTDGLEQRKDDAMQAKHESTRTEHSAGNERKADLSVIGKTVFVKGEVEAAEDMLVEGRLEGSIKHTASRLTVGVSGVVNADINAKNLVIQGTVDGNIVGSESVVIEESAEVRGNIYTARISVADGAQFSGTIDMDISKGPKH